MTSEKLHQDLFAALRLLRHSLVSFTVPLDIEPSRNCNYSINHKMEIYRLFSASPIQIYLYLHSGKKIRVSAVVTKGKRPRSITNQSLANKVLLQGLWLLDSDF